MMNRLLKIARSGEAGPGVQFRKAAYGSAGLRQFLRDVLAMANAATGEPRLIFTGVETDARGKRIIRPVGREDFSGKPSYQALVAEFIEPPLRVRYKPMSVEGKRVGVYEISNCGDRPYMMRTDFSETLRRGDAYIRIQDSVVKMGRRQLKELFEERFQESVGSDNLEIGFPGDIMHKTLTLPTTDLSKMPSAQAAAKLQMLLEARTRVGSAGSETMVARLTHARLFGSDRPYEDKSPEQLTREIGEIREVHRFEDEHFLYEEQGRELQLVILNQGKRPVENASLTLIMPNHSAFYVASRLPRVRRDGQWLPRSAAGNEGYPAVALYDDSIRVLSALGDISTDAPVRVFETPLKMCVGNELRGRKLEIRYSLQGSNLRKPVTGRLRIRFQGDCRQRSRLPASGGT